VDEVPSRAHPQLGGHLQVEVAEALGGHQPAIGHAAREGRVLGSEEGAAHRGVDAIGSDRDVSLDGRAALEDRLHAIAVVDQAHESVADVQALLRQRAEERGQQVGAVCLVVREAERVDHCVAERRAQQRPPVVPAALVEVQRAHAHPRELVGQADAMENPRRVGADLDAGADLAHGCGALVDVDVEAGVQER
jgi:hypothetical protein